MTITHSSLGESGLPCFCIEGLQKTRRNEKLATDFVTSLYDSEMYNDVTLNNWHNGILVIRYARNLKELVNLLNARKADQESNNKSDSSRSLLYDY